VHWLAASGVGRSRPQHTGERQVTKVTISNLGRTLGARNLRADGTFIQTVSPVFCLSSDRCDPERIVIPTRERSEAGGICYSAGPLKSPLAASLC
jgi:hypothetical protein